MLESSDTDGGSSVAVLTYLQHILDSIDHSDLTRLTLQYLFGVQNASSDMESSARPTTLARRRKSQGLIVRLANESDNPSPDLFNLADLILGSLESDNQQTLAATLRLLSVILRKHHCQALVLLLKTRPLTESDKQRTVSGHEKQIDNLLSMAEGIADSQALEASYERYLQDSYTHLESHPCSLSFRSTPLMDNVRPAARNIKTDLVMESHTLIIEDPLLCRLLALMENFFLNDIETNLGLTRVLVDLVSCGYTRIEGWFLDDPLNHTYTDDTQAKQNSTAPIGQKGESDKFSPTQSTPSKLLFPRHEPSWQMKDASPVFSVIEKLVRKVETFHLEVQELAACLRECRIITGVDDTTFLSSKNTTDISGITQDVPDISLNHARIQGQMEGISERLRSERYLGGDSRNSSPRGRQLDPSSTPTLVGRLSHLHMSPSRSPSQSSSRAYSPSPLRNQSIASTPPKPNTFTPRPSGSLLRTVQMVGRANNIRRHTRDLSSSEASSIRSESIEPESRSPATRDVSLGHLTTNVIILQEFILEIAALIEVRAGMFEEVSFD